MKVIKLTEQKTGKEDRFYKNRFNEQYDSDSSDIENELLSMLDKLPHVKVTDEMIADWEEY